MGLKQKIIDIYTGYTNYAAKEKLPEYIKEQVLYRMELCKECAMAPFCPNCKCISPVLFFSPTKTDALGKWGPMLIESEWNKFKTTPEYLNNITKTTNDEQEDKQDGLHSEREKD